MSALPLLPIQNGALFFSATALDTLSRCKREGEYYFLHRRTSLSKGEGLAFGSILHKGLELFYRLEEYGLSIDERITKVQQLFELLFADKGESIDHRTLNWAVEIVQNYARIYTPEKFKLMVFNAPKLCKNCEGKGFISKEVDGVGVVDNCVWCNKTGKTSVMSEVSFVVPLFTYTPDGVELVQLKAQTGLTQLAIFIHGFIDLVGKRGNLLHTVDFKSTSRMEDSFWNSLAVSEQMRLYCFALQETLKLPVDGYLNRGIRTGTIPKYLQEGFPNKKGESKTVQRWWEESLPEQYTQLGRDDLQAWKANTIAKIEEFLWSYFKGFMPENRGACHSKYKCSYWDVCNTYPIEQRLELLNSGLFQDKKIVTPL